MDHRADIYGLGVITYEMLTGVKPYKASDSFGVLVKHVSDPVPEILEANPALPPEVDGIIKRATAKNRNDRYESAVDLARALTKAVYGEEHTLPSSATLMKMQKPTGSARLWGWAGLGTVVLLALAGLFVFRGQLPFLAAPTATATKVEAAVPVPATATTLPTQTPTVTATIVRKTSTPDLPPGNVGKVALLSGNNLYLMNPDGSELTLVRTENSPKSNLHWIAGGRLIYMSRNCAFMLDARTNQVQQLTCFNPDEFLEGFRVSPDGKYVGISVEKTLNILPFDPDVLKDVNTRFNLREKSMFYFDMF